ncbi:MAG TPA: GIY-YIG nuclease family protein [Verrucomicrobiae bacterium]|nr:GIY-YIG nuclease family protein [Verrucomicrobiae bacterium]
MTKHHILSEIKRTAQANGGIPLGRLKFFTQTGIKQSDWRGVHWVRWNDAILEAGFTPNQKTTAYDDEWLIAKLVSFGRELGHFPVSAELRLKARTTEHFPSDNTFRRLGSKAQILQKAALYCRAHEGFDDVLAMCGAPHVSTDSAIPEAEPDPEQPGFVYLLKSGRFYKIGRSNACGRRERELSLQLPEKARLLHEIRTDDPVGIEDYWHRRFEKQRKNGEWFDLNPAAVAAFRRRRFM